VQGSSGRPQFPGTDTKGEAIEPTLVLCIEAFANSLLVPSGHVTFKEIYAAFQAQFPLLADEKHLSPNFLGAHLRDWYQAKYHKELVRARMPGEQEALRAFKNADTDQNGVLDSDEWHAAFGGKQFKAVDANEDGVISKKEFTAGAPGDKKAVRRSGVLNSRCSISSLLRAIGHFFHTFAYLSASVRRPLSPA
jgi:hypothetical protein